MLNVAYCLSPHHVLQTLCLTKGEQCLVLTPNAERYRELFASSATLNIVSIDERKKVARELRSAATPFDYFFAALWNRTGLILERACLRQGGTVNIFEDGVGGFGPPGKDWRVYLRKATYRILDGTTYCDHPSQRTFDKSRTVFHSMEPQFSSFSARRIDVSGFQAMLPNLSTHFRHLERYRGTPAFFDTADCESGWYPFEKKVALLNELLPKGPLLYFPHPGQQMNVSQRIPRLIDLTNQTHGWNELAAYFLQPPQIYSAFSTAAYTLRRVYGLRFENVLMYQAFLEGTGHPAFNISASMRSYFACVS